MIKKELTMTRHMTFPAVKGYATYAAAFRKLVKELGDNPERITTMVISREDGRFIPVALGENATYLIHRGIFVTN